MISNYVKIISNWVEIALSCFAQRLTGVKSTVINYHRQRMREGQPAEIISTIFVFIIFVTVVS